MKRTLKRELKGLEIAKREPLGRSVAGMDITWAAATPARLRLCHAGQHQLGGRDSGWQEGEQALVFWPGALLLQPADTVPGAWLRHSLCGRNHVQFPVGVLKLVAPRVTTAC